MTRHLFCIIIITLVCAVFGCSGGGDNVIAPVEPASRDVETAGSHVLWGLYQFKADPVAQTLEAVPLRMADIHLNALPFLEPPALVNLTLDNLEFNGNIIDVDISLRHPFLGLDEFTGFDVNAIVISNGSVSGFTDSALVTAGEGDTRLLNPDGLSRWWNPVEFPVNEGTMFSYNDGILGTPHEFADYDSTLNGYKYYCDDISDPDASLDDVTQVNRGLFSAGQQNTRHFTIEIGSDGLIFNYAVDANWEFPNDDSPWDIPDDFPEAANSPEAWRIVPNIVSNTLFNDGSSSGGNLSLSIDVYDWFNAELNTLRVESPGNFTMADNIVPTGGGAGYSTFTVDITNATPGEENIDVLISAVSEDPDFGGFITGVNTTAYYMFDVVVSDSGAILEIESPDGGESWVIGDDYEITWISFGDISDVRLDYSTDSGATYPNVITTSTENDGSFNWNIPGTPTTQARVRIQSVTGDTAEDESDDDFTIAEFETGPGATVGPYFDGFGPTGTSDDPIPTEWYVYLDASDIPGNISQYLWEFTGDDLYDDETGLTAIISFDNPGVFEIKLKVLYEGAGENYYNFAGPYYITLGTYVWAAFSGTPDGSRSNPYTTITDALTVVSADGYILVRGDDGADGQCTYSANVYVDNAHAGTRIQGYYGDYATDEPPMQTGYVVLDGNDTTFDGFEVTGPSSYYFSQQGHRAKLSLYNTDGALFRHLYVHSIGTNIRVFWCFEWQGPDGAGTFMNCLQKEMNVSTIIHNAAHDDSQSSSGSFPKMYLINCTFDRISTGSAWGLYVTGGWTKAYVRNCIWTDICSSSGVYLRCQGAFMDVNYSNTYDNPSVPPSGGSYYSGNPGPSVGPNCFNQNPLYVDYLNDHHLATGSPCIDTGDPDTSYNDYDDTRNDMGCYGGPYGDWDFEN